MSTLWQHAGRPIGIKLLRSYLEEELNRRQVHANSNLNLKRADVYRRMLPCSAGAVSAAGFLTYKSSPLLISQNV
ncbi:MAG: hypothetical protein WBX19_12930 [Terracidiphilus sp.]